jgi:hypothetical protein
MKKLAVVFISTVTALASALPAEAFPAINLEKPKVVSNIEQVRDRDWSGWSNFAKRRYLKSLRGHRGANYGGYRGNHSNKYYGRRYYRDYDDDNDAAAIIGGLALGAIVGGALAQPRYYGPSSYAYDGNTHTSWCYSRYRSYRGWDNTFQPYYGPRRQCISPF